MIIIDTTIWSKIFRRKKIANGDMDIIRKVYELLDSEEEILLGPVRQELLSGIANKDIFYDLKINLSGFNNYEVQLTDHDLAAEYFNVCLSKGIQGSPTDYLICAVACRYNFKIFTEDKDFNYYKKYLPIKMY